MSVKRRKKYNYSKTAGIIPIHFIIKRITVITTDNWKTIEGDQERKKNVCINAKISKFTEDTS